MIREADIWPVDKQRGQRRTGGLQGEGEERGGAREGAWMFVVGLPVRWRTALSARMPKS